MVKADMGDMVIIDRIGLGSESSPRVEFGGSRGLIFFAIHGLSILASSYGVYLAALWPSICHLFINLPNG